MTKRDAEEMETGEDKENRFPTQEDRDFITKLIESGDIKPKEISLPTYAKWKAICCANNDFIDYVFCEYAIPLTPNKIGEMDDDKLLGLIQAWLYEMTFFSE